jgi:hypothetical protein
MHGPFRVFGVMVTVAMVAAAAAAPCKADEPLPRSVLILEQSNPNLASYVDFFSAFSAALNVNSKSGVEVYTESLDINRFGSAEIRTGFAHLSP